MAKQAENKALGSLLTSLLSDNNINSVSGKTDASGPEVASVLAAALPQLLAGANAQAQNQETSQSFHDALNEHAEKDPEKVDQDEGEKIIAHLLGSDADDIEMQIAKSTGLSKKKVALVLAAAAPFILKMLSQNTAGQSSSASSTASIIGNLLGGGNANSGSNVNPLVTAALSAVLASALNNNNSNKPSNTSLLGSLLGGGNSNSNNNNNGGNALGFLMNLLK